MAASAIIAKMSAPVSAPQRSVAQPLLRAAENPPAKAAQKREAQEKTPVYPCGEARKSASAEKIAESETQTMAKEAAP